MTHAFSDLKKTLSQKKKMNFYLKRRKQLIIKRKYSAGLVG